MDKVFLTENDSDVPIKKGLKPFIDTGFVEYSTQDEAHAQLHIYQTCIDNYAKDFLSLIHI